MRKNLLLILLAVLVLPTAIYANAGTILMWATAGHLFIGNLFVGLLETFLLRKKGLKYGIVVTGVIIVIANYVSMFVGFIIGDVISSTFVSSLFSPSHAEYIWMNIVQYISLTVTSFIVEFPFYWLALAKRERKQVIKIVVVINCWSALAVAAYYVLFHWGMLALFQAE